MFKKEDTAAFGTVPKAGSLTKPAAPRKRNGLSGLDLASLISGIHTMARLDVGPPVQNGETHLSG